MAVAFVTVALDSEVVERALTRVEIDGKPVILTRLHGQVYALDGICSHEFAELADGVVDDETIWCPLHASGFNVISGEATNPPAEEPIAVYEVRVVDGDVQVSQQPRPPS
jgi:3-phenylpropionate/trans-cinnamate dioxygenase ferredoxin subunit